MLFTNIFLQISLHISSSDPTCDAKCQTYTFYSFQDTEIQTKEQESQNWSFCHMYISVLVVQNIRYIHIDLGYHTTVSKWIITQM